MPSVSDHSGASFTSTQRHDIYDAINPLKTDLSQRLKTVLITGAGRGIGRSIALRYAEVGVARIVLVARTLIELDAVEQEIHAISDVAKVLKLTVDISSEGAIFEAVEKFKNWFEQPEMATLDVLVNNAGISEPWVPIAESDAQEWWRVWEVSIRGTYLMMRGFLPYMIDTAAVRGSPSTIVNISSIGAHVVFPGASAYQTTKLALLRLTEFVTLEYEAKGVNAHSLHPGGVKTQLSRALPDELLPDTSELCGGFVVWLTKENRSWLNGRYLSVSWDVAELEAKRNEIVGKDKLKVKLVV